MLEITDTIVESGSEREYKVSVKGKDVRIEVWNTVNYLRPEREGKVEFTDDMFDGVVEVVESLRRAQFILNEQLDR